MIQLSELICLTETWLSDLDSFQNYIIYGHNYLLVKNRPQLYGDVKIQLNVNCTLPKYYGDFDESITV